jgi:hypothetical protein
MESWPLAAVRPLFVQVKARMIFLVRCPVISVWKSMTEYGTGASQNYSGVLSQQRYEMILQWPVAVFRGPAVDEQEDGPFVQDLLCADEKGKKRVSLGTYATIRDCHMVGKVGLLPVGRRNCRERGRPSLQNREMRRPSFNIEMEVEGHGAIIRSLGS